MIDSYLSIWEISHRWRDVNPDKSDPADLPLNVQDTMRFICRGVLDGKIALFDMVVMKPAQDNNGSASRSEVRPFYVHEHPTELEDCLYRKYDKSALNAYFIEAGSLFDYCLDSQSKESKSLAVNLDYPSCWSDFLEGNHLENELDDSEPSQIQIQAQPIRPSQIDKQICQAIAKTLWDIYPKMTITAMTKHNAILNHGGGKLYTGKNTLRDWVREVAPDNVRNKPGRPKNSKPNKDVA